MDQVLINGLLLWQFTRLGNTPGVRHFVTSRWSDQPGQEFTLSYSSTPDRPRVQNNRSKFAAALGVTDPMLFVPSQVHKTNVVRVQANTSRDELAATDALITNTIGMAIAVMAADCVPILLYDARNHAIGAVHSGWRGTVAKILHETLSHMKQTFGTEGAHVQAALGPSVCQESYEVGEEVIQATESAFGSNSGLLKYSAHHKARLDLWKANRIQLQEFGVPATHIEVADLCTVKNNDHFFSARRGDSGRFAAGIVLV